jgi:hypothetical protein
LNSQFQSVVLEWVVFGLVPKNLLEWRSGLALLAAETILGMTPVEHEKRIFDCLVPCLAPKNLLHSGHGPAILRPETVVAKEPVLGLVAVEHEGLIVDWLAPCLAPQDLPARKAPDRRQIV